MKYYLLLLLLATNTGWAFDYGDPSPNEQAHLEAINYARLYPLDEAQRLGIDLFEGTEPGAISGNAVQPLSSNSHLLDATRAHSEDMLNRDFFAHNNPDGESPFDRMRSAGYVYQTAGENLAYSGSTGSINELAMALQLHDNLFLDTNYPHRGHRVNILNPNYREVGVGLAYGLFNSSGQTFNAAMVTTDFGRQLNSLPILLGVVYDDINKNNFYDAGEGVSSVEIRIEENNESTLTASAGGYGLEVTANSDYSVSFYHEDLGSVSRAVHIGNLNIKLDVLLSDFSKDNAKDNEPDNEPVNEPDNQPVDELSQCSAFAQNQLTIPCVLVNNELYSAELSVIEGNGLQFVLSHINKIHQSQSAQCGTFQPQTEIVHLPCIEVGVDNYWADLQLVPGTEAEFVFKLVDYDLN
ncbi:MAG: hypothetical protein GQ583_09915 [Methyloprofundus sp.]|nr:hypothetical protein [Methyloprofundus sp.]